MENRTHHLPMSRLYPPSEQTTLPDSALSRGKPQRPYARLQFLLNKKRRFLVGHRSTSPKGLDDSACSNTIEVLPCSASVRVNTTNAFDPIRLDPSRGRKEMTPRLLFAILATLLVFGGPVAQAPLAVAESNCADLIDNDGDSAIDCADPSCDGLACDDGSTCTISESCSGGLCLPDATTCGDGVVDGACGEQCEPVAGAEICDSPDDVDGDGLVGCLDVEDCCGTLDSPNGVSCSSTCQLAELCRPIIDDPAKIKLRPGKTDFSKMHGRILVTPEYNASLNALTYLISNSFGDVVRHELPAGALFQKKATRWTYKDRDARDSGGIASINSRLRRFGSEIYYTFKIKTYGDYTGATEATMTTQLFGVEGVGYLRADWTERKKGWTLKNRDLRRAELLCEDLPCNNGAMDGEETDVDCGGSVCPPCPLGGACLLDSDCITGECISTPPPWVSSVPPWTCSIAGCTDGTQNQDETDVDCGGVVCPGCPDGGLCNGDSDCANGFCLSVAPPFTCLTPTCSDGYLNQDETDVDCGGATCAACSDGNMCVVASDCVSGVCSGGICQPATCSDTVQNQDETDVDCGGTTCAACSDGGGCLVGSDCVSGVCSAGICQAPTCSDAVQNQDETDVDCGGATCAGCPDGDSCNIASDCLSGVCTGGVCQAPTCSDAVQNQDETDVDCGGATCTACPDGGGCLVGSDCTSGVCSGGICQAPTCSDAVQNQDETDVDCGGSTCPACPDGDGCNVASDCTSGVCTGGICQAPTCSDAVQNQDETDVDCGGATCPGCPDGDSCSVGSDCASGVCSGGVCQAPTCADGVQNQDETDVDCGGSTCPACPPGDGCSVNSDCTSGVCSGGVCQAPTCSDSVQNQDETDVDCGGSTCPGCPIGDGCNTGSDCLSGACSGGVCQPSCTDGIQNQGESDVDCGGPNCSACPPGDTCNVNSDCTSGFCVNGICRPPGTCNDGQLNQNETDIDCGGVCGATCLINETCNGGGDCQSTVCTNNLCKCSSGAFIFNFSIGSNGGGATDSAEWPGGTQAMNTPATTQCSTTIDNPSGNIDLVGNLGDDFAVLGFSGFSNCFGNGGEDGDGCNDNGCPFAGIGSCESNRPSCSVATNGSGGATFRVQCNP